MQAGALKPYERALKTADPLALYTTGGRVIDLDIERWLGPADDADESVLARCAGPVLDVGCGPGRMVAALIERGTTALGVDIAETAVALTRRRGLPSLHRSVFSRIPGEGRWSSVLLMDGNIGIGGDPHRLLQRVRELLRPGGNVLIETDPSEYADELLSVRFCQQHLPVGPTFPWAQVGLQAVRRQAIELGYRDSQSWTADRRTFIALRR